jgi:serine/threonine protein kinase
MSQAGIRPAHRSRRVGDYTLDTLLGEGPAWQDWSASHVSIPGLKRRIRLYRVPVGAPADLRQTIRRAAEREFQILQGISHPGILKAIDFREDERGPALIFEHDPAAQRLDLYMRERGASLTVEDRLRLLRDIAETIRYAHEKHLIHRALSPQAILVTPLAGLLPGRVQIFSWQAGSRAAGTGTAAGAISATAHPDQLVEDATTVYMAPEAHIGSDTGERLDVFSLGALVWFVFTGRPPADSLLGLTERLREGGGLRLSSVMNGANRQLEELVQYATQPAVSDRLNAVTEVLYYLDLAEKELLPKSAEPVFDPTEARAGDELPGGFVVVRRLGKGSTAMALLASRNGKECVLKVALSPEQNDGLVAEGEVIEELHHQHIVHLYERTEIGGRSVLVLEKAGDRTLADRLRDEGRLHIELLNRLGDDLLETVDWLEAKGISHRDIKPDNLGVSNIGQGDRLELVLFDFSLSRTPADQIRAGTVPYVDPFLSLRKPPRWDRHAERFAVAVTLYEMATGTFPRWGDGQSDPAVIDNEVTLESDLFDASLRDGLTEFFQRALRRRPEERFDNAQEMLTAWRRIFVAAEEPIPAPTEDTTTFDPLEQAIPETAVSTLRLSTRALNALDRLNVLTVLDLLKTPTTTIWAMRGVGHKTRRELGDLVKRVGERFPNLASTPKRIAVPEASPTEVEPTVQGIDLIVDRLIPKRTAEGGSEARVLRLVLGLDDRPAGLEGEWPTQTDVAMATGITRARVSQLVGRARERWAKEAAVTSLRATVASELERNGRVMTARELADILLARRGSVQTGEVRRRWGLAAGRAAVEAEARSAIPRFIQHRSGSQVFVAASDEWADYAERLGRAVDRLLEADAVVSPQRALDATQDIDPPEDATLSSSRLLTLAAAASSTGAVSPSRLELYRRDLDAARALKLASSTLVGVPELTVEDIRERVASRYPDALPLPDRPALDSLLAEAGLPNQWIPEARGGRGAYRLASSFLGTSSDVTSTGTLVPSARGTAAEITPEAAAARQFQERLQYAARQGAFLAVSVPPRLVRRAEERLAREFNVELVDVDERLIAAMRDEASDVGADWQTIVRTDAAGPGSPDWPLLLTLAGAAVKRLESSFATSSRTLLLRNAGLLARYDQLGVLGRIAQRAGRRDSGLHGAWVLLPSGQVPSIGGQVVPIVTPGQMAVMPERWARESGAPREGIR